VSATEPSPTPGPSRPADSHVEARFRYVRRIDVRFGDLDALGHVNHVVYLSYVEQVRTQYFQEVLGIDVPSGLTWVIARVACDYLLPLAFGDRVDVGWRISRLGRASADYEFVLMRGAGLVARGDGVLVNSDARAARSAPIPDAWRNAAAEYDGIERQAPRPL
jgi:acyl-CoA thioester hydrolase